MSILNSVYESTNIKPKKPFTEQNLRMVVDEYNQQYSDNIAVNINKDSFELSAPKNEFGLINLIESTLRRDKGYKLIDGKFIIPF